MGIRMRRVTVPENRFESCNSSNIKNKNNAANAIHRNTADCYRAAYQKLYSELPAWKRKSFESNIYRTDDTLYNEFIQQVIELAEK